MFIVLLLFSFCGMFAILHRKLYVVAGLCPLLINAIVGIILYVFALSNCPRGGYYFSILCGIVCLAFFLWDTVRNHTLNACRDLIHPVLILWMLLIAWQYFLSFYGVKESMWDSGDITKHWGLLPRLYMSTNDFVNKSLPLHAPDYPPMVSLLDYFYCRCFNNFSDNMLNVSNYIMVSAFLIAASAWIRWSYHLITCAMLFMGLMNFPAYILPEYLSSLFVANYYIILCICGMFFLLSCKKKEERISLFYLFLLFYATSPFSSGILKDNLQWICMLSLFCTYVLYFRLALPYHYVFLGLILALSVQLKPSCILFTLFFVVFVCVEQLIRVFQSIKLQHRKLANSLFILSAPVIMLMSYFSWNVYVHSTNIKIGQTTIDQNPIKIICRQLSGVDLNEKDKQLIHAFKDSWVTSAHNGGGWHASTNPNGICQKLNGFFTETPHRGISVCCNLISGFSLFLIIVIFLCVSRNWSFLKTVLSMNVCLLAALGFLYFGLFFFTYNFHQGIGWSYPRYSLPFMVFPFFNFLVLIYLLIFKSNFLSYTVLCGIIIFIGFYGYVSPLKRIPPTPTTSSRSLIKHLVFEKACAGQSIFIIECYNPLFCLNNIRYEACMNANAPTISMDLQPHRKRASASPEFVVILANVSKGHINSKMSDLFSPLPDNVEQTLLLLSRDEKCDNIYRVTKQFYTLLRDNTVFETNTIVEKYGLQWDGNRYTVFACH